VDRQTDTDRTDGQTDRQTGRQTHTKRQANINEEQVIEKTKKTVTINVLYLLSAPNYLGIVNYASKLPGATALAKVF
jgi:hypothetical protein